MKAPFFVIQAESRTPGNDEPKSNYYYRDPQTGGYPAFDDTLFRAEPFRTFEEALKCFELILKESPTTFGIGDFSQHAIPTAMRRACGGRIDLDGEYFFTFSIFEVLGKNLNDLFTVPRRVASFSVKQFHNKPNTAPVFTYSYNGPTSNG